MCADRYIWLKTNKNPWRMTYLHNSLDTYMNTSPSSSQIKWAATTRLPLKNRSKWLSSGRQLPVTQWQNRNLACAISSASGKRQPITTRIRVCHSIKFALGLNTRGGNLSEVNKTTLWLVTAPVPIREIVHATSAHNGTMLLDWRKLTPIWATQTVAQTAVPLV